MYHIPDLGRLLKCILPELIRRATTAGCALPVELGKYRRSPLVNPRRGEELADRAR